MALCSQVVDLVRLDLLDDPDQVGGIGQVTIMQIHAHTVLMPVLVKVIDTIGIERRGPALDAVHLVALAQQELRQIRAILSCYARDQCFLGHASLLVSLSDVPLHTTSNIQQHRYCHSAFPPHAFCTIFMNSSCATRSSTVGRHQPQRITRRLDSR